MEGAWGTGMDSIQQIEACRLVSGSGSASVAVAGLYKIAFPRSNLLTRL